MSLFSRIPLGGALGAPTNSLFLRHLLLILLCCTTLVPQSGVAQWLPSFRESSVSYDGFNESAFSAIDHHGSDHPYAYTRLGNRLGIFDETNTSAIRGHALISGDELFLRALPSGKIVRPPNVTYNTDTREIAVTGTFSNHVPASTTAIEFYSHHTFRPENLIEVRTSSEPDVRKVIVAIHGWNPDAKNAADHYGGEFAELLGALGDRVLQNRNLKWDLLAYDWTLDAATGSVPSDLQNLIPLAAICEFKAGLLLPGAALSTIDGALENATEAAEIAHLHGWYLGSQLAEKYPNLEQVHIIAHSAGSWATRTAVAALVEKSNASISATVLDAFIPGASTRPVSEASGLGVGLINQAYDLVPSDRRGLFESHVAEADVLGIDTIATQEFLANWDVNTSIKIKGTWLKTEHSAPIEWYRRTVQQPELSPVSGDEVQEFIPTAWSSNEVDQRARGFAESNLFEELNEFPNASLRIEATVDVTIDGTVLFDPRVQRPGEDFQRSPNQRLDTMVGSQIRLEAPAIRGAQRFLHWESEGLPDQTSPVIELSLDTSRTFRAVYTEPISLNLLPVAAVVGQEFRVEGRLDAGASSAGVEIDVLASNNLVRKVTTLSDGRFFAFFPRPQAEGSLRVEALATIDGVSLDDSENVSLTGFSPRDFGLRAVGSTPPRISPNGSHTLRYEWYNSQPETGTAQVTISLLNPSGEEVSSQQVVTPSLSSTQIDPTDQSALLNFGDEEGLWTARLTIESTTVSDSPERNATDNTIQLGFFVGADQEFDGYRAQRFDVTASQMPRTISFGATGTQARILGVNSSSGRVTIDWIRRADGSEIRGRHSIDPDDFDFYENDTTALFYEGWFPIGADPSVVFYGAAAEIALTATPGELEVFQGEQAEFRISTNDNSDLDKADAVTGYRNGAQIDSVANEDRDGLDIVYEVPTASLAPGSYEWFVFVEGDNGDYFQRLELNVRRPLNQRLDLFECASQVVAGQPLTGRQVVTSDGAPSGASLSVEISKDGAVLLNQLLLRNIGLNGPVSVSGDLSISTLGLEPGSYTITATFTANEDANTADSTRTCAFEIIAPPALTFDVSSSAEEPNAPIDEGEVIDFAVVVNDDVEFSGALLLANIRTPDREESLLPVPYNSESQRYEFSTPRLLPGTYDITLFGTADGFAQGTALVWRSQEVEDLVPTVEILNPRQDVWITSDTVSANWRGSDPSLLPGELRYRPRLNGRTLDSEVGLQSIVLSRLVEGENTFRVDVSQDGQRRSSDAEISFNVDRIAPELILDDERLDITVSGGQDSHRINGVVRDLTSRLASFTINGDPVFGATTSLEDPRSALSISAEFPLEPGDNLFEIVAQDVAGNVSRRTLRVTREIVALSLSETLVEAAADGGEFSVTVSSDEGWSWSGGDRWLISAVEQNQSGDLRFTFSVQPNFDEKIRIGQFSFTTAGQTYFLTVTQAAVTRDLPDALAPSPDAFIQVAAGGVVALELESEPLVLMKTPPITNGPRSSYPLAYQWGADGTDGTTMGGASFCRINANIAIIELDRSATPDALSAIEIVLEFSGRFSGAMTIRRLTDGELAAEPETRNFVFPWLQRDPKHRDLQIVHDDLAGHIGLVWQHAGDASGTLLSSSDMTNWIQEHILGAPDQWFHSYVFEQAAQAQHHYFRLGSPLPSPVLSLPFDGNFADSSGNNYPVTAGSISYAPDRFGQTARAVSFNNDSAFGSSFVNIAHNDVFNSEEMTMACRVYLREPGFGTQGWTLIARKGTLLTHGLFFFRQDQNEFYSQFYNTTNSFGNAIFQSPSAAPIGRWVHLAQVISSVDGGTHEFYVDGVLAGRATNTGPRSFNTSSIRLGSGSWSGVSSAMNGYMDDFQIFDVALTAAQVSQLAQ